MSIVFLTLHIISINLWLWVVVLKYYFWNNLKRLMKNIANALMIQWRSTHGPVYYKSSQSTCSCIIIYMCWGFILKLKLITSLKNTKTYYVLRELQANRPERRRVDKRTTLYCWKYIHTPGLIIYLQGRS